MECPNTGEFCGYLTHFSKVRGLAALGSLENAVEGDNDSEDLFRTISDRFGETINAPEKSACDERYCAALSNAAASALITGALQEHKIISDDTGADK